MTFGKEPEILNTELWKAEYYEEDCNFLIPT
jgi:hypothetical protein